MKNALLFIVSLLLPLHFLLSMPINTGSADSADVKSLSERMLTAIRTSEALKLQYTWNSRVDVTREGKVMDVNISLFKYGTDGKISQTVINDESAALPSSFLIHRIAENEKDKIVAFIKGAHDLIQEYFLNSERKLMPFLEKAQIVPNEKERDILLSAGDILKPGDKITWWISSDLYTTNKLSICTDFEGQEIEFTATFCTMQNGMNYMTYGELLIPSKGYTIMIHNYDYLKQGQN